MSRPAPVAVFAAAIVAAAAALGAGRAAAAPPAAITVDARPGQTDRVATALGRSGLRVQRRLGRSLQVVLDPGRAAGLARLPGVAGARPATTSFSDELVSQGLERTGADVIAPAAGGGAGLKIAVLDLGFGTGLARLQALGELPPANQLETLSFDAASGLAGTNAYGNRTNHGEIVAQTVYDYAPQARYLFVNYHSEADFIAATDAVIARHPDIVVHANSFLEGPFDGTGPLAREVDKAAAAGILWFNSAGNYAQLHWQGPWQDADGDNNLDWPNGNNWTFPRAPGQPITFALSWSSPPGGPPTDLDLILERQEPDGSWLQVASSTDRQSAGMPPSERITGYAPQVATQYRLRVVRVSGPPPAGNITLFSREIPLAAIGGAPESSIPTPGDAVGAVAIGAVDWRGNALKPYSSQGPTDDGRLKPDLVAPTDTTIMGPNGPRSVGGTSNAAPNAAGAAALLLAASRRAGGNPTAADIRATLDATALDLGAPGPDNAYGYGRVRVSTDPPRIVSPQPVPSSAVRGRVTAKITAVSKSRVVTWTLDLDGKPVLARPQTYPHGITLDTRTLAEGVHTLRATAVDFPGNVGALAWQVRVDNTPPLVVIRSAKVQHLRRLPRRSGRDRRLRAVRLVIALDDPGSTGPLSGSVTAAGAGRRSGPAKTFRVAIGQRRTVAAGRLPRGRWTLRLTITDQAGNATTVARRVLVR